MSTQIVLGILFVLTLSSCGSVKISDSEFCGDMGSEGAQCFNLLSDKERRILLPEWEKERFGMICTKADAFIEWKSAILKLCGLTKRCKYDVIQNVIQFEEKILDFNKLVAGENHAETNKQNRSHEQRGTSIPLENFYKSESDN